EDVDEVALGVLVIALVEAVGGAAVADEVLGGREDSVQALAVRIDVAEALERGLGVPANDGRILGVALVGAAPPVVANHRQRRAERPVLTGGADLGAGRNTDLLDQAGVVG